MEGTRTLMAAEETAELAAVDAAQLGTAVAQLARAMEGFGAMVQMMNDRMTAVEQEMRLLTKVTPAQERRLNSLIRQRSREVCAMYRAAGCEAAAGNAIRRAIRLQAGVRSMREIPRCEYKITEQLIQMWEDRKVMKDIMGKGA